MTVICHPAYNGFRNKFRHAINRFIILLCQDKSLAFSNDPQNGHVPHWIIMQVHSASRVYRAVWDYDCSSLSFSYCCINSNDNWIRIFFTQFFCVFIRISALYGKQDISIHGNRIHKILNECNAIGTYIVSMHFRIPNPNQYNFLFFGDDLI